MNTIRPDQPTSLPFNGEVSLQSHMEANQHGEIQIRDAMVEIDMVFGGGMAGKDSTVKAGCLRGNESGSHENEPSVVPRSDATHAEVRAVIVASKPGNSGGAKGGRKADASCKANREIKSATVPVRAKQAEESVMTEILRDQYHAKRGVWSEKMLRALHEGAGEEGNVWFSLIDKVYREETLELAWQKVRTNAGASGVDRITVGFYAKDAQNRLLGVREQLQQGTYQPKPVKQVKIPKLGSAELRPLGIPAVQDRIVQAALVSVIEPIFEKEFAPHSYGFRPGRGCKDALRRVNELVAKEGLIHVVDVDFKSYFDTIPHDRLMELVKSRIADSRVLELIQAFLTQGVVNQDMQVLKAMGTATEGTPQGGVISPLLANLYLNELDWRMERTAGVEMVRYADDAVILCRDESTAKHILEELQRWSAQVGLILHPQKTKIVDMGQPKANFDFLGYRFQRSKTAGGQLRKFIRPKSLQKLRATLIPLLKRSSGWGLDRIFRAINPKLKGFYAYFKHASARSVFGVDEWVRGRLRSILRRRRRGKGRGRGKDHHRWPIHYFNNLGLFNLLDARRKEIQLSLRKGATC